MNDPNSTAGDTPGRRWQRVPMVRASGWVAREDLPTTPEEPGPVSRPKVGQLAAIGKRPGAAQVRCEGCRVLVAVASAAGPGGWWLYLNGPPHLFPLDAADDGRTPPRVRCRCDRVWTLDPDRVRAASRGGGPTTVQRVTVAPADG